MNLRSLAVSFKYSVQTLVRLHLLDKTFKPTMALKSLFHKEGSCLPSGYQCQILTNALATRAYTALES